MNVKYFIWYYIIDKVILLYILIIVEDSFSWADDTSLIV